MNYLDKIVEHKRNEVRQKRTVINRLELEASPHFKLPTISLRQSIIERRFGIIAEIKRKSPSKGGIQLDLNPKELAKNYEVSGAAGISVLTDQHFFGGSNDDLLAARSASLLPILRKDFIIDEYQIFEAKSIGADCILLIAEVLEKGHLHELALIARSLGMEVLMEIHTEGSLEKLNDEVTLIGVNNRNLATQEIALETSRRIYPFLPQGVPLISESGIHDISDLREIAQIGYQGALIGTSIVAHKEPSTFLSELVDIQNIAV